MRRENGKRAEQQSEREGDGEFAEMASHANAVLPAVPSAAGLRALKAAKPNPTNGDVVELGRYIVADPRICHGKPTFRGTRIMVHQVLADVAAGKSWDFTSQVCWGGRVSEPAIAEAVEFAEDFRTTRGLTLERPAITVST